MQVTHTGVEMSLIVIKVLQHSFLFHKRFNFAAAWNILDRSVTLKDIWTPADDGYRPEKPVVT